ncbi:peptidoglycan DD-metalloendopeptidase family protein [Candidatus Falkowbacteria bacterium]|nr:peptidoglycan DD-metalloendopeptidase family protein [Candidatus Falkowbacteria bacterium]
MMRRLGWNSSKTSFINYLLDQKLVHVFVGVITFALVFTNLIGDTKAQDLSAPGSNTILSSLIQSEFSDADSEQLIEETFDQEQAITSTQQKYLDSLSSASSQPVADVGSLDGEDAPIEPTESADDATKNDVVFKNETAPVRTEITNYTVEQGDTISTIAKKFDIGVNTILWQNNLNAYSVIRPGDVLSILPVSGVVHTVASGESLKLIASKYDIDEQKISETNNISDSGHLKIGQKLIIPGGRKDAFTPEKKKSSTGLALIKDLIVPKNNKVVKAPYEDDEKKIPKDSTPPVGNKMAWPTSGYRITQYYSWRHYAIDVADHIGTPLYAADAGVIETAGWGKGYGNQIVINHGGGKKTRYAHLSKFYVKVGDQVDKGETIGAMGSTGWSTGSHLHFEVIINGVKYNPLNYVR